MYLGERGAAEAAAAGAELSSELSSNYVMICRGKGVRDGVFFFFFFLNKLLFSS